MDTRCINRNLIIPSSERSYDCIASVSLQGPSCVSDLPLYALWGCHNTVCPALLEFGAVLPLKKKNCHRPLWPLGCWLAFDLRPRCLKHSAVLIQNKWFFINYLLIYLFFIPSFFIHLSPFSGQNAAVGKSVSFCLRSCLVQYGRRLD